MRLNMSIAQKNSPKKEAANRSQSEKKKGKKQSAETIEKRIAPLRGVKKSPEFCANLSLKMKGRIFTDEQKINMSNGQKNSEKAKENFKKVLESNIGKKRSSDFKNKLSIRFKNVPKSEEHKRKISEAHKGQKRSEETRQKMIDAHARRKEKKIQDALNLVLSS
jgi:predicted AAA+ superfamily ATPase